MSAFETRLTITKAATANQALPLSHPGEYVRLVMRSDLSIYRRLASIGIWIACVGILWASYNWNVFRIPLIKIDAYSEGLVVRRMTAAHAGQPIPGGFLILPPERAQWVGISMYMSSPGWQGRVLSAAHAVTGGSVATFVERAKAVFALLAACIAAGVVVLAFRHLGALAAGCTLIAFALSPPIVTLARDLYWSLFIPMGCGLAAWMLLAHLSDARIRPHVVYGLLGVLTLVKSLTGYEWITAVALNACVPIVYFAYLGDWKRSHVLRHAGWIVAYCVAGFLVALGVHTAQGFSAFGNWQDAWSPIISRASANTYGNPFYGARFNYENPQYYPSVPMIRVIYGYLTQSILTLPGGIAVITLLTAIGAAAGAVTSSVWLRIARRRAQPNPRTVARTIDAILIAATVAAVIGSAVWALGPARSGIIPDDLAGKALFRLPGLMLAFAITSALVAASRRFTDREPSVATVSRLTERTNIAVIIAVTAALLAAFSWVVLAKHHSAYHTTVNAVLFSMLFVPLLAGWLGHTLSTAITSRRPGQARSF